MNLKCTWNERMQFTAQSGAHEVKMDTLPPLGNNTGLTPKQLLLAGICGCTAMDVVALLKKYKQPLESFEVNADATPSENRHPAIFKKIQLTFKLKGQLDPQKIIEAVTLSQTQYCGVSAMVFKAVPIYYHIEHNGAEIGNGQANFNI